jgi:hypothetical protein
MMLPQHELVEDILQVQTIYREVLLVAGQLPYHLPIVVLSPMLYIEESKSLQHRTPW